MDFESHDKGLLNYVKNYKVPKKLTNVEEKHILLPLHIVKSKEKTDSSKPNPNINSSNKTTKKNKYKSVGKPSLKTTKSSKHSSNHKTSKEVPSIPQKNVIEQNNNIINIINIEDETKPKKEVKPKKKKKHDILDYNKINIEEPKLKNETKQKIKKKEANSDNNNKILLDLKKENLSLKDKLSKIEDNIDIYKKKCEDQINNIKNLKLILQNLKSNETNNELNNINNYDLLNDMNFNDNFKENFNDNYKDDFKDSLSNDNDYNEEELAIKAVEQQIMDELCPNPDAMTYEQLLQLEDDVGKVNKGLTNEQIDKLPTKKYRQRIDGDNNKCIICMEEFEEKERVKYLPCEHLFHHDCIRQWLLKEKSCPYCKSEIG